VRLERVELETVRGRLSRKAAAGRRRIWERSGIRIRLWADGRAGQGEAAPGFVRLGSGPLSHLLHKGRAIRLELSANGRALAGQTRFGATQHHLLPGEHAQQQDKQQQSHPQGQAGFLQFGEPLAGLGGQVVHGGLPEVSKAHDSAGLGSRA